MKKTLTLMAVLVAAGIANAASLNWSILNISQVGSTDKATGYTAYLFITAQSGDFGATVTTVDAITTKIEKGEDISAYIAATGTSNSGSITGSTGYYNNFSSGDSLTAFAVIFDASDYASASNYFVTAAKSASWTSATGAKTLGFGNQASATWSPTSVPEPGTAALALLGVGMLLKRRRA